MKCEVRKPDLERVAWIHFETWIPGMLLLALLSGGWASAQVPAANAGGSPEGQKRLDLMKSKGPEGSLTIFPVRLAGKPWDRVTEVVGLLLERQGLKNIELGKTVFDPGAGTGMVRIAAVFGEFVRKNPITTEYALYAEFNGNRQAGLDELLAVVVDKTGAVVWTERQTPQDAAFRSLEVREPMTLSVLLVERLSPRLGLDEETARAAKPGRLARLMDERSGMPPEEERAPLPGRLKMMKDLRQKVTLAVFPARIAGREASVPSATNLANLINHSGLCQALPAKQSVLLKASQADPNELKVLWDLAREFREYLRKNPMDVDYSLYADYVFNPRNWQEGFVHFVVCDRNGEWVIVDKQNSHQSDYQRIKPASEKGCDQLLLRRLEGYLRPD